MNTPRKSPSRWRAVVIVGAWAVLAPTMTPIHGAARVEPRPMKKAAEVRCHWGVTIGFGPLVERAISAQLRP